VDLKAYPPTAFGQAKRTPGRHGYVAYFPEPIPRRIELGSSTVRLLADAEASLGRLAGMEQLVPNLDLLMAPYLLREALSSTRIEGTQATMAEVYEVEAARAPANADVEEVLGYVEAMRWGVSQLDRLPLSTRLMCGLHRRLMAGVRGRERMPGEFRRSQNWIGGAGATIESAEFVPPPPDELPGLLRDWEQFANEEPEMPLLVQDALLHSQFETIHPFLDGNGRLGRLLLVLFMIERGRLASPLLYLSSYLERDREAYYDALRAVRHDGDPAPWIDMFLSAVRVESQDAHARAGRLIELQQRYRQAAADMGTANGPALVDLICENPVVTTRLVEDRLGVSRPTALRLLRGLQQRGVVSEAASGARGQRRYVATELVATVSEDTAGDSE
jgi:Fic family protein